MVSHPEIDEAQIEHEIANEVTEINKELERRKEAGLETYLFVSVTGGEGCGKTTVIRKLQERLNNLSALDVQSVKMLGGNEMSDAIRNLVLSEAGGTADRLVMMHLMQAAMRATAIVNIEPRIKVKQDKAVLFLSDRSPLDTAVYQGYASTNGSVVATGEIAQANIQLFYESLISPSLILFVDLDPAVGLARKHAQGEENHFERQLLQFHEKVRDGFSLFNNPYYPYMRMLDGRLTPKQLELEALRKLNGFLQDNKDKTLLGSAITVNKVRQWAVKHPERTAELLSDKHILRDTREISDYFETWRSICFSLRDNHYTITNISRHQIAERIQQALVTNPTFRTFAEHFLDDGPNFLVEISALSPDDFIQQAWSYVTYLSEEVKRATSSWYPGDFTINSLKQTRSTT